MSNSIYPVRRTARKMAIDFNLTPWSAAEIDTFEACSANQDWFKDAYVFTVHFVQEGINKSVTAIDSGVEDFVARLRELYERNGAELKMLGVFRYGSNETHFCKLTMCINVVERIGKRASVLNELLEKAFDGRAVFLLRKETDAITPIDFAKKYGKAAVLNTDEDKLPCGMAMLSYGLSELLD